MDKVFIESGYKFDFSGGISAIIADKPNYSGLSAVDFIVETKDEFLFIEIKNPDNPKSNENERKVFLEALKSELFPYQMSGKFKDTLLCRWAFDEQYNKPIRYIILLQFDRFGKAERGRLKTKILGRLPSGLNKKEFKRRINIWGFNLVDIDEFGKEFPVFTVSKVEIA